MSVDGVLRQSLVGAVAPYIPASQWWQQYGTDEVWVSVFRVHRVPFGGGHYFFDQALMMDLGKVRALFLRMDLHYPNMVFPWTLEPSGKAKPAGKMEGWKSTGDGVVLLLMTPFVGEAGVDTEAAVRERIGLTRAIIVSVLGRTAAFEVLTEFTIGFRQGDVSCVSPVLENPEVFNPPKLNDIADMNLVGEIIDGIPSLEQTMQKRVRLALHWYQRALGDHRVLKADGTGNVDELIDYWIALETLSGVEGKKVAGFLIGVLAKLHGLTTQKVGERFPISPVYKRRKEIVHEGEMRGISKEMAGLLSDIFVDTLALHILKLSNVPRTAEYLDGRGYGFL